MKGKLLIVNLSIVSLLLFNGLTAQDSDNPLEQLSFYIGSWGLPSDIPMMKKNPKMKDFKVIDFEWGKNNKVIKSRTGIFSESEEDIHSEGIITYNPTSEKIVWLEYQITNEILFEGEYMHNGNNIVQRVYTVYYPEGYELILYPELDGWTRRFRETFTPTSKNNIDWLTEVWIDGKWVRHKPNRDSKAIRDI